MSRLGLVVIAGGCALVAACTGSAALTAPIQPTAPLGLLAHQAALNRGSMTAATLDVDGGATSVHITTANLTGKLLTVVTSPVASQRPILAAAPGGVVTLRFASAGAGGGSSVVDVVLDRSVTWRLDLAGGATTEVVDMRGGHVALIDLSAGASNETIDLPASAGTQVVRELGGASNLTVTLPKVVATQVDVHGGASSVVIGTATHTGVGGNHSFVDPRYPTAADRLELDLQGGVSHVHVRRS
jgi:hypothetical protein